MAIATSNTTFLEENMPVSKLHWSQFGVFIYGIPVIIVNLVGNIMTLLAFVIDPKLRACNQNMYIVNLAMADLAVGLISMPLDIYYTHMRWHWGLGRWTCKFWLSVNHWAAAEASLTIILISYDRMIMIRDGENYDEAEVRKKGFRNLAITWVVSFLLYVPTILGFDYLTGESVLKEEHCKTEFHVVQWFHILIALIELLLPLVCISTFCTMLVIIMYKRTKDIWEINPIFVEGNLILAKEKALASCLCLMVVVFVICWAPITIFHLLRAICYDCGNDDAYKAFELLLHFNATVNPIHYAHFNARFRAHYRRMLCPCIPLRAHRKVSTDDESVDGSKVFPLDIYIVQPSGSSPRESLNIPEMEEWNIPERPIQPQGRPSTSLLPGTTERRLSQGKDSLLSQASSNKVHGIAPSIIVSDSEPSQYIVGSRRSSISPYQCPSHHVHVLQDSSAPSMYQPSHFFLGNRGSGLLHRRERERRVSLTGTILPALHKPSAHVMDLLDFELGPA